MIKFKLLKNNLLN